MSGDGVCCMHAQSSHHRLAFYAISAGLCGDAIAAAIRAIVLRFHRDYLGVTVCIFHEHRENAVLVRQRFLNLRETDYTVCLPTLIVKFENYPKLQTLLNKFNNNNILQKCES